MVTHEALSARFHQNEATFSPNFATRAGRAISWLGRAMAEGDDSDARFIFMWISFNAAYGKEISRDEFISQKANIYAFFQKVIAFDQDKKLYDSLWDSYADGVRAVLNNPYIFDGYWQSRGKAQETQWKESFARAKQSANEALSRHDSVTILKIIFNRFYVLRNQLFHGGATYDGKVNRAQVIDCAHLMDRLLPLLLDIMLHHPEEDWGEVSFPRML